MIGGEFLFSIEQECLTVLEGPAAAQNGAPAMACFLEELARLAPGLPGRTGIFNGYGRVYLDGGHLEFAAAECDSPLLLPVVVEQQHLLATRAMQRLRDRGLSLVLANNNHSGVLRCGSPTWGTHENYLVERHPRTFADLLLPFLVSRVYAGAGGVLAPRGDFVAGVRNVFLETDVGGGTTTDRAIHSTALEEHHLGPSPSRFRYHLVLGDGHRSHFSLALQVGATALALKGVFFRPDLILPLPGLTSPGRRTLWLQALKSFNRLAAPGNPPRAHPLALKIQRLYLDGARRYADAQPGLPGWVTWLLDTWEQTLARLAADDRDWLAARLDPWIKYELYSTWLKENGYSWHDLAHRPELLDELALLDQHYHEFTRDDSPFRVLEQAGLLAHRLAPTPAPGSEPEPFVPATATRAAARARFIRNHCDHPDLVMDWAEVFDQRTGRRRSLAEPFAADFGPWEPGTP